MCSTFKCVQFKNNYNESNSSLNRFETLGDKLMSPKPIQCEHYARQICFSVCFAFPAL